MNNAAAERSRLWEKLLPGGPPTLWCPPLTHYRPDGSIDHERIAARVASMAPYVKGVLVPGSTGDGWELADEEAVEVLSLFLAENVDLRILTLPEGMDPADFLGEHGAEAFADLLATRARDALEHAFEAKTRGLDLEGDVHASSQALEEILAILATAPRLRHDTTSEHRLRQEKILGRLAFMFRARSSLRLPSSVAVRWRSERCRSNIRRVSHHGFCVEVQESSRGGP